MQANNVIPLNQKIQPPSDIIGDTVVETVSYLLADLYESGFEIENNQDIALLTYVVESIVMRSINKEHPGQALADSMRIVD